MKTAKVVGRQPNHIVTMINFNWNCLSCDYENTSSLSEEEDLIQNKVIIETCRNCRYNNHIKVYDIYNPKDHD